MLQTSNSAIDIETDSPALLTLYLPHDLKLNISHEDFEKLAAVNRDIRLERTSAGELIVNPPTGWETGERNADVIYQLLKWVREQGGNGKVFDSSTAFILPNGATYSPDASWISQSKWNSLTDVQQQTFARVCPEFVVELRSKSDLLKPLQEKMAEYMENGAKVGWLINPKQRQVEVYRAGKAVEILQNPQTVSGEDVLVGFVLQLNLIW
ncbi:MAG: Uma2 family endonuclease [Oscillatoriaceae cyanobacterium Prado104]|jgi:Uma2 family endonuclease|nr:Uma2 family endonuclease [Oscillatoriaceae cyanobacterium Prado104]